MTISRRNLFGAGLAAAALASTDAARAAMGKGPTETNLRPDGTYATVDLAKDAWTLGVVQSRVMALNAAKPEPRKRENLQHMLDLIDYAQGYGGKKDLLFFHEFPITGYSYEWGRKDALKIAIDIPGPETEALAKKAKQHDCWLVFGSYARDPDWPDHLLSITSVMDNQGRIVDKHWKARNIKGVFVGFELFTTTIHDALDRYVEMYGYDAVVPVTRTPLGNICTSSIQREPEYFRAMAMKGGEVILRTASGGFTPADMQATSLYNGVYTAVCNNAASPGNGLYFEDAGGGGSAIYGPRGEELDAAPTSFETLVTARIPIKEFRARHRQPNIHTDLYLKEYETYRSRHAPNLFSSYLPTDGQDAKRFLADKSRWK
jgi:predicted amidohydrolase